MIVRVIRDEEWYDGTVRLADVWLAALLHRQTGLEAIACEHYGTAVFPNNGFSHSRERAERIAPKEQ